MRNKTLIFFSILSLLMILETVLFNYYINLDLTLKEYLTEIEKPEFVDQFFNLKDKFSWLTYLLIPIGLIIKAILVSTTIYIGAQFVAKIQYRKVLLIAIRSEYIFLLVVFFRIIWFSFFHTNYNYQDILNYYPLSALSIIGYQETDSWFIYPLQVLNLFELAYWFVLAYLLRKELNTSMDEGFRIVITSYVPALAIWVVAVMFFTLSYS